MAQAPDIRVRLVPSGVEDVTNAMRRVTGQVTALTGAVIAAGAAVFAWTKRTADVVDELGKMSQKVGVSVESLSALKYAADLSDVSLESLSVGLRQLSKNMAETQAGTGEARDAFRALGISVVDSAGQLKPTEQMLLDLADRFSKMQDGAGKTAIAMRLFGRSGADLIPLLNQGRAGIEQLRKEAERLGIVFSTEAAKAAEQFNDDMRRLQATASGLSIHMAGPFVKAFGEAARAMLDARKEGEGFFKTISEGLAALLMGGDRQRWAREMANAGDALLKAQREFDQAMNVRRQVGMAEFGDKLVRQATEKVAKAKAEILRLRAIETQMAPEIAPAVVPGAGGEVAPALPSAEKDQDLITKQNQWAIDEEIKVQSEIAQITDDFRVREREAEKAAEDLRIQILIEAYDREQEEAIAHGQVMLEIARHTTDEEIRIMQMGVRKRAATLAGGLADMTAVVASGNRTMFNINKLAGIANVALTLPEKISDAYKWGTKIGGPYVGAAFAAVAAAAGISHIRMMQQTSFDAGGGVAPSVAATPAPPVTPVVGGGGGAGVPQTTIIQFQGSSSDEKLIRRFVEMLNENSRDGGRLIVA